MICRYLYQQQRGGVMVSGMLSYDGAGMRATQDAFGRAHRETLSALEQLATDLERNLGRWEDEARDAYFDAQHTWQRAATALARAMVELGEAVGNASDNYGTAARAGVRGWLG